jgi:hypothetical protein
MKVPASTTLHPANVWLNAPFTYTVTLFSDARNTYVR